MTTPGPALTPEQKEKLNDFINNLDDYLTPNQLNNLQNFKENKGGGFIFANTFPGFTSQCLKSFKANLPIEGMTIACDPNLSLDEANEKLRNLESTTSLVMGTTLFPLNSDKNIIKGFFNISISKKITPNLVQVDFQFINGVTNEVTTSSSTVSTKSLVYPLTNAPNKFIKEIGIEVTPSQQDPAVRELWVGVESTGAFIEALASSDENFECANRFVDVYGPDVPYIQFAVGFTPQTDGPPAIEFRKVIPMTSK